MGRLGVYVQGVAAPRYQNVFTGLAVDAGHHTVDVYRIPSAAFDADVCAVAEQGVTVRLHDTRFNRAILQGLAHRISNDMHRWDGTFELREVGVDEQGYVLVGVDNPTIAEPLLRNAYPTQPFRVEHVAAAEPALLPRPT